MAGKACARKIIRLVNGITRNRIRLAADSILRVVAMLNLLDAAERNAFFLEIGQQRVSLGFQHDAFAYDVMNILCSTELSGNQHIGRMLKNNRQRHDGLTGRQQ